MRKVLVNSRMTIAIWIIVGLSLIGVIARPMNWPEWIWAVAGAAALVAFGFMPLAATGAAISKGTDVYLFLTGMMLLSEAARAEGAFDWVAVHSVKRARQSPKRLFLLIFLTGVVVTTFLSNDATAVVLTPAVLATARKAKADPLPLLFSCALIANAASFVLPISNPANLVLFGDHMPPLGWWLASFTLPSLASVIVTFFVLRFLLRARLSGLCEGDVAVPSLGRGGKIALTMIALTAVTLIAVSAFDIQLGLPTIVTGLIAISAICISVQRSPLPLLKGISWGILPLVAGLFVLVEAVNRTGAIDRLAGLLQYAAQETAWGTVLAGSTLAVTTNLMNNLPAGLMTATAIAQAQPPRVLVDSLLIAVDLGPNLSVTGSLATLLWLQAIRREGQEVSFWTFLKIGAVAMPLALAAALAVRLLI